jgi:1-aminocyclopropane-1-carboxylate deaminase
MNTNFPSIDESKSIITELFSPLFEEKKIQFFVKREDLIHPYISGNKWRKLKYNISEAKHISYNTILTFGGAFSNHIYATAAVGKVYHFNTIGIIRGERTEPLNDTLDFAERCGMKLHFISREQYRLKTADSFLDKLKNQFGNFYLLPEGGTNELAVKGCAEILEKKDFQNFTHIACCMGTGGTFAGLIKASENKSTLLAFPVLKGDFFAKDLNFLLDENNIYTNYQIINNFHFGGYAKNTPELEKFMEEFYLQFSIPLEFVYTGKMFYGLFEMIKKNEFIPNSKILAIHTGGLRNRKLTHILKND